MNKTIVKFIRDSSGVTLVEYGIAIGLAIALGATAFGLLAGEITAALQAVGQLMTD